MQKSSQEIAAKLIELGGDEWKKGGHHRVYIYGHMAEAFFESYHAGFGKAHQTYFNANTRKFTSTSKSVTENLNCYLLENT